MDKRTLRMAFLFIFFIVVTLMLASMFSGLGASDLADKAKKEFNEGKIEAARKHAEQLLGVATRTSLSPMGIDGDAIHDGNMVLGRIALKEGHKDLAKEYLLKAGMTSGSPVLDSFGPNMSLAKDLIEAGERDTVIKYFEECRKFWEHHQDTLDTWEADVKAGKMPDFGANLDY